MPLSRSSAIAQSSCRWSVTDFDGLSFGEGSKNTEKDVTDDFVVGREGALREAVEGNAVAIAPAKMHDGIDGDTFWLGRHIENRPFYDTTLIPDPTVVFQQVRGRE